MNATVFNSSSFLDDDIIVFSSKGGNFTSTITIPSGGSSASHMIHYEGESGNIPTFHGNDTLQNGIVIYSKNYLELKDLIITHATDSDLIVYGTSTGVEVRNITATYSGNQAFQNMDSASVAYYDITGSNNVDDGFSMHDSSVATISGGTFENNSDGINWVGSSSLTASNITLNNCASECIYPTDVGLGGTITGSFNTVTIDQTGSPFVDPVVSVSGVHVNLSITNLTINNIPVGSAANKAIQVDSGGSLTLNTFTINGNSSDADVDGIYVTGTGSLSTVSLTGGHINNFLRGINISATGYTVTGLNNTITGCTSSSIFFTGGASSLSGTLTNTTIDKTGSTFDSNPIVNVYGAATNLALNTITISNIPIGTLASEAIFLHSGATLSLNSATLTGNSGDTDIIGVLVSDNGSLLTLNGGDISNFSNAIYDTSNQTTNISRVYFHNNSGHVIDIATTRAVNINYSIFSNIASAKFAVAVRAGVTANINNITVDDNNQSKDGKGIFTAAGSFIYLNNSIFSNLSSALTDTGATTKTLFNNDLYGNTSGNTGTWVNTNGFAVDPIYNNLAANDFHLKSTSTLINVGKEEGLSIDYAGNTVPQGSAPEVGAYEYIPLTVTVNQASGQTDPTAGSTINYTVVFSESVSDFATGDVTLSGTAGATTATVTGSGTTYNVAVSGMTGSGTVIATLVVGVATGATGNTNAVSTSTDNTVNYDATAPTTTDNVDSSWHSSNVTVTLTCSDNSSGCANTYYTTDGTSPTTSSSSGTSFILSTAGTYTIKYFSVDNAGNTESVKTATNTVKIDKTIPSGGLISYSDGNYTPPTSVFLTVSDGTDSESGVNTSTRAVLRKSAIFNNDNCGNYGSFATISVTGTYPNFTDSGISSGSCYQYEYQVSDNAGNQATYTSSNIVKVLYAPPGTQACSDTTPAGTTPWLYEANSNNGNSITLRFTNWQTPVDHFALEYGTSSNNYQFAVDNIGNKDTNLYTVNSLNPNTTYYFRVRSGNGCASGSWSNELSTKTLGFISTNNLSTSQSSITPVEQPSSCQTYTVESGDTLWKIATNLLGNGNKYQDIINENFDSYPNLKTSSNISIGWELKINCQGETNKSPGATTNTPTGGYKVNIKVKDTKGSPVENATVTLHSTPQTQKTNSDGVATFSNVESGNHTINIAYNNYQGEQSINLTGDVKEFNINVTVQQKAVLLSPLAIGIIGVLILVIAFLVFKQARNNKIKKI